MVENRKITTISICGGALPLDFLNTVSEWTPAEGADYFEDEIDFLLWTAKLSFLAKEELNRFSKHIKSKSHRPNLLKQVRDVRTILFQIFRAIASNKAISPESLDAFSAWTRKAHASRGFVATKSGVVPVLDNANPAILPLLYVVLDAERMILDASLWSRIRMCSSCGWFFLDTSKGGKRRWCDMSVCGSRDKALRYYHNSKGTDK
jgi:Conserved protein containing a Zn-ribbon-like motif, possibly RNA-binding